MNKSFTFKESVEVNIEHLVDLYYEDLIYMQKNLTGDKKKHAMLD